jgi:hypothetical protein
MIGARKMLLAWVVMICFAVAPASHDIVLSTRPSNEQLDEQGMSSSSSRRAGSVVNTTYVFPRVKSNEGLGAQWFIAAGAVGVAQCDAKYTFAWGGLKLLDHFETKKRASSATAELERFIGLSENPAVVKQADVPLSATFEYIRHPGYQFAALPCSRRIMRDSYFGTSHPKPPLPEAMLDVNSNSERSTLLHVAVHVRRGDIVAEVRRGKRRFSS